MLGPGQVLRFDEEGHCSPLGTVVSDRQESSASPTASKRWRGAAEARREDLKPLRLTANSLGVSADAGRQREVSGLTLDKIFIGVSESIGTAFTPLMSDPKARQPSGAIARPWICRLGVLLLPQPPGRAIDRHPGPQFGTGCAN